MIGPSLRINSKTIGKHQPVNTIALKRIAKGKRQNSLVVGNAHSTSTNYVYELQTVNC